MLLDEHIVYDEFKRRQENEWQPEALRLPLHVPRYDEDHSDDGEEETSDRGVLIIDMNDGYSIVE